MKDQELIEAMWEAVHSDIGVAVTTTDVDGMRRKFYALRKQTPEFECLSTVLPHASNDQEVWILKTSETDDAQK